MAFYNKDEIKDKITLDDVVDIVRDFGGDPKRTAFGFIAATICHNHPGEGSHKLYYYENTKLFRCYTGCDSTFDIFELVCKIHNLGKDNGPEWKLYDGVRWVASKLGFAPSFENNGNAELADWSIFNRYDKLHIAAENEKRIQLKEYDAAILDRLVYPRIADWIDEGISEEALIKNRIGFCPLTDQITIPHYDAEGRFIGLRGRMVGKEEAELYGKYRPMVLNGQMYNHPLGFNLYNFNNSKEPIKKIKKAIVFEGEKSTLKYQSYFGEDHDISVACCGSAVSAFQMNLLINCGAREIVIAFDKQFQKTNDDEFKHLVRNLKSINQKYGNYINISFIFDKKHRLGYKDSPVDKGPHTFLELFKERIIL